MLTPETPSSACANLRVMPRALMSWSSGKDSAFALHEVLRRGDLQVVGLLTTVSAAYARVAMHGVRRVLLEAQAQALGLPLHVVELPSPCTNAIYEQRMGAFVEQARAEGIDTVIFGDLFLEDIRAYRERQLDGTGLKPVFPLWGRPTHTLAKEMVSAGIQATITCLDPRKLDRSLAGQRWDIAELPADVDPCGENGEFHTFVHASPDFSAPLDVRGGEVVERDGFVFADLLPA